MFRGVKEDSVLFIERQFEKHVINCDQNALLLFVLFRKHETLSCNPASSPAVCDVGQTVFNFMLSVILLPGH
jgi:hypothetical protein